MLKKSSVRANIFWSVLWTEQLNVLEQELNHDLVVRFKGIKVGTQQVCIIDPGKILQLEMEMYEG